jgi:hypothetical protein
MAKIEVTVPSGLINLSSIYGRENLSEYAPSFSLCSSPKDGRRQCIKFTNCKAYLHDSVYDYLTGSHLFYDRESSPPIDMNKLRLLIGQGEGGKEFKKNLYAAKKVVNFYEETAGWELSKITQVDHTHKIKDLYLVTGPKQWMSAPQLLSMVTFVLRICAKKGPVEFGNNDDLEKLYEKWQGLMGSNNSDGTYLKDCRKKLYLVAKYHDRLFAGFKPEDLYVNDYRTASSHSNGIQFLCKFTSATPELNKRFKEICEENGVT